MLWDKIRLFLIIWLFIILLLIVGAVVVYHAELVDAIRSSFTNMATSVITLIVVIGLIAAIFFNR